MHFLDSVRAAAAAIVVALVLTACGGGGGDSAPPVSAPTDAQRASAAQATADSSSNACAAIRPFYWEIGNSGQRSVAGSVGQPQYSATSQMAIASASKWLYAADVVQRRGAALDATDVKYLTFRSGYTNFSTCLPNQTVDACLSTLGNGVHSSTTDGKFFYNGGHMQAHASLMGLGPLGNAGLAAEVQSRLGTDIGLSYSSPQLAGAAVSTADDYARFLRKLLRRELKMGDMLGAHAVCTNQATCAGAISTPVPSHESWHYSLGHWVEDDPVVGDGAFSSPGSFGFYPWIDSARSLYGIVARRADAGAWYDSVVCGRLIRKAWVSAVAL